MLIDVVVITRIKMIIYSRQTNLMMIRLINGNHNLKRKMPNIFLSPDETDFVWWCGVF